MKFIDPDVIESAMEEFTPEVLESEMLCLIQQPHLGATIKCFVEFLADLRKQKPDITEGEILIGAASFGYWLSETVNDIQFDRLKVFSSLFGGVTPDE